MNFGRSLSSSCCCDYDPQFEGDKFVDGLLGIGSAGGQSSGADGAQLASRLSALRKERAERAPLISRASLSAAPAETEPRTFDHVSPQGAAPAKARNNAAKRKKRKKKKGKR